MLMDLIFVRSLSCLQDTFSQLARLCVHNAHSTNRCSEVGVRQSCDKQQTPEHDGLNITPCMWGVRLEAWQCGPPCLNHNSSACNICSQCSTPGIWCQCIKRSVILRISELIRGLNRQQLEFSIHDAYTKCSEALDFDTRAPIKLLWS